MNHSVIRMEKILWDGGVLRGQCQHRRRGPCEYGQIHRKPPGGDVFELNLQV